MSLIKINQQKANEVLVQRLESAIDAYLDSVANQYRYESIRTMVTYATSDHPVFGVEGRAAVSWRDACYQTGIDIMNAVMNGDREVPSEQELIAEMPLISDFME
jgi:hypothetical protein